MVMSITRTRVEMLINNSLVRFEMRLGSATAASVMLQADERGHFITAATIDGQPMPVLVDTGATAVAMNLSNALRAGVSFAGARRVSVQTAAGPRQAVLVRG
jgi:aspartyl protease family protein